MAIFQGGNEAIFIEFEENIESVPHISCGLYVDGVEQKHWDENNTERDGSVLILPITQQESAAFTPGACKLLTKFFDDEGNTIFYNNLFDVIEEREDKNHLFGS